MKRYVILFEFLIFSLIFSCSQPESNNIIHNNEKKSNIKSTEFQNVLDTNINNQKIANVKIEIKKSLIEIDSNLIISFLDQMIQKQYSGKGIICSTPIEIPIEIFNCSTPNIKNTKPNIVSIYDYLLCSDFKKDEIKYLKEQAEILKDCSLKVFGILNKKYSILECDTIKREVVVNEYSIPLFTKDKKTALIIFVDRINKTAISAKRIEIYKRDENNKWNFFKYKYEENSD